MACIQWSDSLSVGIAEIDQQHQQLVQMLNQLHDAMQQGKGRSVLGNILEEMAGYTQSHFRTEEKYFDRFGYPEAEGHKQAHAQFVHKVSEFKEGFARGELGLSVPVMNFLSTWLQEHIKGSDQRYAPFLKEKGLK